MIQLQEVLVHHPKPRLSSHDKAAQLTKRSGTSDDEDADEASEVRKAPAAATAKKAKRKSKGTKKSKKGIQKKNKKKSRGKAPSVNEEPSVKSGSPLNKRKRKAMQSEDVKKRILNRSKGKDDSEEESADAEALRPSPKVLSLSSPEARATGKDPPLPLILSYELVFTARSSAMNNTYCPTLHS